MKVFSAEQVRSIDLYTIEHEPVSSIDLMERAATVFVHELLKRECNSSQFYILAGTGNNGGDGLAVARLLDALNKQVLVFTPAQSSKQSPDFRENLKRLSACSNVEILDLSQFPAYELHAKAVIIDALFGTGLSRPVKGIFADCIQRINEIPLKTYAIDIPSGLFCDEQNAKDDIIVRADVTFTFQFPKYSFFCAENEQYVGNWVVCDISLHPDIISHTQTDTFFVDSTMINLHSRSRFSHKGTYGHAAVIAGSEGKNGAAVLSAQACLKAGAGLVTACVPKPAMNALLITCPEIMCSTFSSDFFQHNKIAAIGIGPGIGVSPDSVEKLRIVLQQKNIPKVFDADALNCLGQYNELRSQLDASCVLTPHPGEFDRLTQTHTSAYARLISQKKVAQQLGCYIILKGAYSSLCTREGTMFFNSSGNPGMASAGMGDVLTGIITSLLAQQYTTFEAALYGMYIHGLAGDVALKNESHETLIATSIIDNLAQVFKKLDNIKNDCE